MFQIAGYPTSLIAPCLRLASMSDCRIWPGAVRAQGVPTADQTAETAAPVQGTDHIP